MLQYYFSIKIKHIRWTKLNEFSYVFILLKATFSITLNGIVLIKFNNNILRV